MSLLKDLAEDFNNVSEKAPILPAATYNALFTDWYEDGMDGDYPRLVLVFTLQDNPTFQFPDGTPVDGSTINYSLFLPQEEDKTKELYLLIFVTKQYTNTLPVCFLERLINLLN